MRRRAPWLALAVLAGCSPGGGSLGALHLTVAGLPAGTNAAVTVIGPTGAHIGVDATTTLNGLAAGTYTVQAAAVAVGSAAYRPTVASQQVVVDAGTVASSTEAYALTPPTLVVTIDAVYITQGAQGYDFSVPLIADRPGLVRVFLKASDSNTAVPDIRVRLYAGGAVTNSYMIHAPSIGVPTAINEADGTRSWNIPLPEHLIQPGTALLVDVDPAGNAPLATRANLTWPASGTPQPLNVIAGANYSLMFVPVINAAEGTTGNVTADGVADFTGAVRLLHPMWSSTATVHAPYTFTGGPFKADDGNFNWQGVLQQIEMLRQAEGGPAYYYGVLHPTYSSGVVGLGYVGAHLVANFRSAVGWDSRAASGGIGTQAGETYAHELGHNLGLMHAPCGGAGNPDPAFPYAGGGVGHSGYNVMTGAITPASDFDLMSYCGPTWISDYSYRRLAAYSTSLRADAPAAPQRAVMVSGAIHGGHAQLNPMMELVTTPVLPFEAGPYRLEARQGDGSVAFALSFAPTSVGDSPFSDLAHFVFSVPLPDGTVLTQLRLSGPGIDTTITASSGTALRADTTTVSATRVDAATVRLTWSEVLYPMLMVRDANTGSVLAFARGGSVVVRSGAAPLMVTVSDGVRSTQVRLTP